MRTCRVCRKDFIFNDEYGYDKSLCGPLCDGIEAGRSRVMEQLDAIEHDACHSDDADATLNSIITRIQKFKEDLKA